MVHRRKGEKASVAPSELQAEALLERLPSGVQVCSADGTITFVSAPYERILGFGAGEALGRKIWSVLADQSQAAELQGYLGYLVADQPDPTPFYAKNRRRDGRVIDVQIDWDYMRDDSGQVTGFVSIVSDVTERSEIERQLLLQAKLLDSVREAVIATDLEGRVTYWGRGAEKLYGYARRELRDDTFKSLLRTPFAETSGSQRLQEAIAHGGWSGTYLQKRKDGSTFWADTIVSVVTDDHRRPAGLIAIERDVSEALATRQALEESEERYRIISELGSDYYYALDLEDDLSPQICWVGGAYERITGLVPNASPEHPWLRLVHLDDYAVVTSALERLHAGESVEVEYRIVNDAGQTIWLHDRARPARLHANAKVVRVVGAVTDITHRKADEEARRDLEASLRHSHKMEAIGTLAGGIAHDFNNLVGAMLGFAELSLLRLEADSPLRANMTEIVRAGMRAKDIVKQILAFSRKTHEVRRPVRVNRVVREALGLLRATIPATIDIHEEIPSADLLVVADPGQLLQVIINLATNAFQAMHETGGRLSVRLSESPAGSRGGAPTSPLVCLAMIDTGPGILPEILDRIFEPYFSTKGVGHGSGMGLAVAHGIISAHGGTIKVESELGVGTTFVIELPCMTRSWDRPATKPTLCPTGVGRVLLVDDEPALAELGAQLLESLGYEPESFVSSSEAWAAFEADPTVYDAVVTDQTMPGMTGAQLTEKMLELRPDLPVVICTGHSDTIGEREALRLGARSYLLKPVSRADLAQTLHALVGERTS